jgi:hypothetical protein
MNLPRLIELASAMIAIPSPSSTEHALSNWMHTCAPSPSLTPYIGSLGLKLPT